jgi:ribosome-binding factor A
VSTRRQLKAAAAVREVVSMAILTEVRDPRVRDVTVTGVEMDADMRSATIHVSVMGDEAKQKLALRGLANSAGFLQSRIADRIETRYTPRLSFEIDGGVKKSLEIARVLAEVLGPSTGDGVIVAPADAEAKSPELRRNAPADEAPGEDVQEQA